MTLPALVALTPGDDRDLLPWLRALGEVGLPAVLVREPQRPLEEILDLVKAARAHVPIVWVHSRCPLDDEVLAQVHGVHLPDDGRPPHPTKPWGRSCHDAAAVRSAWRQGASWTFLSPIHPPTSKPHDRRPTLGIEAFAGLEGPVYGLGGLTPARHRAVLRAGATGSAVLGDLFGRPTPEAAAYRLRRWLDRDQNW